MSEKKPIQLNDNNSNNDSNNDSNNGNILDNDSKNSNILDNDSKNNFSSRESLILKEKVINNILNSEPKLYLYLPPFKAKSKITSMTNQEILLFKSQSHIHLENSRKVFLRKKEEFRSDTSFIQKVSQAKLVESLCNNSDRLRFCKSDQSLFFSINVFNESSKKSEKFGNKLISFLKNKKKIPLLSREFLFVTINLFFFTFLAIVHRSNYSKDQPFAESSFKQTFTTICKSKLPNVASSSQKTSWEYFNQIKPGYLYRYQNLNWKINEIQEKVGFFMNVNPNPTLLKSPVFVNGRKPLFLCKNLSLKEEQAHTYVRYVSMLKLLQKVCEQSEIAVPWKDQKQNQFVGIFPSKRDQINPAFNRDSINDNESQTFNIEFSSAQKKICESVIPAWYCIKACNQSKSKIRAVRMSSGVNSGRTNKESFTKNNELSTCLVYFKNLADFYKHKKKDVSKSLALTRFQYYLPFYLSKPRIFCENDAIPSKRDTIYTNLTKGNINLKRSDKYEKFSQVALKRGFYKYGFIWNVKKSNTSLNPEESFDEIIQNQVTESQMEKTVCKGFHLAQSSDTYKKPCNSSDLQKIKFLNEQNIDPQSSDKLIKNFFLGFKPDITICNTSVSGYKFAELNKKEIIALFIKQALFNLNLELDISTFFKQGFYFEKSFDKKSGVVQYQIKTPFCTFIFKNSDLVNKVLSTPLTVNTERLLLPCLSKKIKNNICQSDFIKSQAARKINMHKRLAFVNTQKPIFKETFFDDNFIVDQKEKSQNKTNLNQEFLNQNIESNIPVLDLQADDIKMEYTQIDLNNSEEIRNIFDKLGRDYQDYLQQPKDTLPALILSPSLEDDHDIEEEGIEIIYNRELKNKNVASTQANQDTFGFSEEGKLSKNFLPASNQGNTEQKIFQDRQNDSFAERFKIDKSSSIDKTSLFENLLMRTSLAATSSSQEDEDLEESSLALYESLYDDAHPKNVEKSKIKGEKTQAEKHKILVVNALQQAQEENDRIDKILEDEEISEDFKQNIERPPLSRLEALYEIRKRERKSERAKDLEFFKIVTEKDSTNKSKGKSKNLTNKGSIDKNKSFLNNPSTEFSGTASNNGSPTLKGLCLSNDNDTPNWYTRNECDNSSSYTSKACIAPVDSNKNLEKEILYVNGNKSNLLPPQLFNKLGDESIQSDRKHSFFGEMSLPAKKLSAQEQKQIFEQKQNPLLKAKYSSTEFPDTNSVNKNTNTENQKQGEFTKFQVGDVGGSVNRIYFYNNLWQNKNRPNKRSLLKNRAPEIKGTPLKSDLIHRAWQAKRIQPSTFRVYPRGKKFPIFPKISQKDWKNIIEWQLKKHFLEEDKRLFSLLPNKNKTLKIKKVNLYLPWIYCCDPTLNFSRNNFTSTKKDENTIFPRNKVVEWPLTRLDFTSQWKYKSLTGSHVFCEDFINSKRKSTASEIQRNEIVDNKKRSAISLSPFTHKSTNYWRLPIQQNILTAPFTPLFLQDSSISKNKIVNKNKFFTSGEGKAFTIPHKKNIETQKHQKNRIISHPQNSVEIQKLGITKKVFNKVLLFEQATTYSWLFLYIFFLGVLFKQLSIFIYRAGLKNFIINFVNSDFGRTVTSDEFRYSIQNPPLANFYMSKKRLKNLVNLDKNKAQLLEIIWFLRNNCQGRNGPRGVLLVKPPNVEVESISVAQVIAGEANVPIIVQSLDSIAQATDPQKELEKLYSRARKQAPCVLFLDQLDTIGARRDQLLTDNTRQIQYCSSSMVDENQMFDFENLDRGFSRQCVQPSKENNLSKENSKVNLHNIGKEETTLYKNKVDTTKIPFLQNLYPYVQKIYFFFKHKLFGCKDLFSSGEGKAFTIPSVFMEEEIQKRKVKERKNRRASNLVSSMALLSSGGSASFISQERRQRNKVFNDSLTKDKLVSDSVYQVNKLSLILRLLTLLDGINNSTGVITVATTSDFTKLDPALLRPKRFSEKIFLSSLTQEDRVLLFKVETKNIGHSKEIPWNYLGLRTENMSVTEIKSAINYSRLRAILKNSVHTIETLEHGIECVKRLTDKRLKKAQ